MAETITVVRDFFKELTARGLTEEAILGLDIPRRKEAFLRWKWFDSSSFNELEGSRRSLMSMMTKEDVEQMIKPEEKRYWSNVLKWEEYCRSCLKRLGVIPSDAGTDSIVQKVAAQVNGRVTGGYARKDWND